MYEQTSMVLAQNFQNLTGLPIDDRLGANRVKVVKLYTLSHKLCSVSQSNGKVGTDTRRAEQSKPLLFQGTR